MAWVLWVYAQCGYAIVGRNAGIKAGTKHTTLINRYRLQELISIKFHKGSKMKFLLFFVSIVFLTCNKTSLVTASNFDSEVRTITDDEKELLDSLNFELSVLGIVLEKTPSKIKRLARTYGEYNYTTKNIEYTTKVHEGISFECTNKTAHELTEKFREELRKEGYLMYKSKKNYTFKPDEVSIIKSQNQFDIIRIEDTRALNYELKNTDIITKLQEWNTNYPFQITGASNDWLSANFVGELPKNSMAFAKEMYEFCPDIVEQGTDTIEKLESETKRTNQLYLWWD